MLAANEMYAVRLNENENHGYRGQFQRDRDRVSYTRSFRRLSNKTQIFLTGQRDHLRTRLTHSIEVNHIAKTISKELGLNVTLTEAIALGHDIGHTPFGHIGERTLNLIMNGCLKIKDFNEDLEEKEKGFKHNLQGIKVLNMLESKSKEYRGLNLTTFTLWGIVNHTGMEVKCKCNKENLCLYKTPKPCPSKEPGKLCLDFYKVFLELIEDSNCWSFEALVVRIADEIAQRHHDIEDGVFIGIIKNEIIYDKLKDLFYKNLSKNEKGKFNKIKDLMDDNEVFLYKISQFIIEILVNNAIKNSRKNLNKLLIDYKINTINDFYKNKKKIFSDKHNDNDKNDIFKLINYDDFFVVKDKELHEYLKNTILNSFMAQKMDGKAEYIIKRLYEAFVSNPLQLPDRTIQYFFINLYGKDYLKLKNTGDLRNEIYILFKNDNNIKAKHVLLRTICDYISAMTDNYAYNQYEVLYGSTQMIQYM